MKYAVLIQPDAEKEIESAYAFIRERSPEGATGWYDNLIEAILSLEKMPHRCAVAPESEFFNEEIRYLLHHPYRILFTVRGATVHVLHVRHSARRAIQ